MTLSTGAAQKKHWVVLCGIYLLLNAPSWLLALPISSLARSTFSGFASDAVFFEPGAWGWLELLRLQQSGLASLVILVPIWFCINWVLHVLLWSTYIEHLLDPKETYFTWIIRAKERFISTMGVTILWLIVRLATLGVAALVSTAIMPLLAQNPDERVRTILILIPWFILSVLWFVFRVVQDLSFTSATAFGEKARDATATGFITFSAHRGALLWANFWRVAVGLLSVLLFSSLTQLIGVSTTGAVILTWLCHQSALFVLVWLRSNWFSVALGHIQKHPPPDFSAYQESPETLAPGR